MKILVTGSNGMIGTTIKKISVRYPKHKFIFLTRKECDLTNQSQVDSFFKNNKFDTIIHLAANVGGLYKNLRNNATIFKDNINSEFMKSIPIYNYSLIFSNYLFSLIIGFLQSIITLVLITSLNNDNLNSIDFLIIMVIIIPSIIIVANISFLINFIKNRMILNFIHIIFFILISFSLGSFFPLKYFPEKYVNIVQYLPICGTIINIQKIVSSDSIYFSLFIISIIYSILFSILFRDKF